MSDERSTVDGPPGEAVPIVEGKDPASRILTVPNVISLARLACIPIFLWLLFGRDSYVGAAVMLAVLGCTDWVDGTVARRFNQVSDLGKMLDPIADRLLLGTAIIAMLIDGAAPAIVAWPVIIREVGVSAAVLILASMGAKRLDVTRSGKFATAGLLVAFPLFLLGASDLSWADGARLVAWIFSAVGLFFSYASALGYVPLAREALRAGKAERAARSSAEP